MKRHILPFAYRYFGLLLTGVCTLLGFLRPEEWEQAGLWLVFGLLAAMTDYVAVHRLPKRRLTLLLRLSPFLGAWLLARGLIPAFLLFSVVPFFVASLPGAPLRKPACHFQAWAGTLLALGGYLFLLSQSANAWENGGWFLLQCAFYLLCMYTAACFGLLPPVLGAANAFVYWRLQVNRERSGGLLPLARDAWLMLGIPALWFVTLYLLAFVCVVKTMWLEEKGKATLPSGPGAQANPVQPG